MRISWLGGGNSKIFFYFHPDPCGDDPIWRAYFSNGWFNHQLSYDRWELSQLLDENGVRKGFLSTRDEETPRFNPQQSDATCYQQGRITRGQTRWEYNLRIDHQSILNVFGENTTFTGFKRFSGVMPRWILGVCDSDFSRKIINLYQQSDGWIQFIRLYYQNVPSLQLT